MSIVILFWYAITILIPLLFLLWFVNTLNRAVEELVRVRKAMEEHLLLVRTNPMRRMDQ